MEDRGNGAKRSKLETNWTKVVAIRRGK